MIIGVTGLIGSGKGAVAESLIEKGFIKLGHSDIIDEELIKRKLPITRDAQVALGNEMRKLHGTDYWAQLLIKKIEPRKNYVVEGFRNVGEVEAFRTLPDFVLIGVAAGLKRRSARIVQRNHAKDSKNREERVHAEQRDLGIGQAIEGQQNALCFAMADRYILNEGTLEDLERQVAQLVKEPGV